ncbi:hypothetical protein D3C77_464460 [compost metagenome]
MKNTRVIARFHCHTSRSGALEVSPAFCSARNSGLSSSLRRMYMEIRPMGPATRNGMRQPQSCISSAPSSQVIPLATTPPSTRPSTAVTISQQVEKPRRPGPAYSEMKLVMVPISPPAEKP